MSVEVEVLNETGCDILETGVASLVQAVLEAEDATGGISVVFVEEAVIASLNERYRDVSGPTDVLSFPEQGAGGEWPSGFEPGSDDEEQGELGEILVCPQVVSRYAQEENNSEDRQLAWTLVHGVLHLLGYDHEVDRGEMRDREQVLLVSLQSMAPLLGPGVGSQPWRSGCGSDKRS